MFLSGSDKDWIPAKAGLGPISEIVKNAFKKKYIIPPTTQSRMAKARYFHGLCTKRVEDFPRTSIHAADDLSKPIYRQRVYQGRLLPRLSRQSTEMKRVKDWIQRMQSKDALSESNPVAVYDKIRKTIATAVILDGQISYIGYPPHRDRSAPNENFEQRERSPPIARPTESTANMTMNEGEGMQRDRSRGASEPLNANSS